MMAISGEKVGRKHCIYGSRKKDTIILVEKVKGMNHE
jgi:hypothetical protein